MKHTLILTIFFWCMTFFAQANVPPPDTIRTAIKKDDVQIYCPDTTQFIGGMASFENLCPASSGSLVNMVPLPDDFCISYGGLGLGMESACIRYCDDTGVCDTTILEVTVVPDTVSVLWPIAVDDVKMTNEDQPVVIDVLDNDVLPNNGAYTSIKVITPSAHGIQSFDDMAMLTYTPNNGFCGAVDTIEYEICNIAGCDTAIVLLDVASCLQFEGVKIFDGFSPNDDGINDSWRILGLEDYPNHDLKVFNRWGNLVFETKSYKSDWNGEWDTTPLPTGTYFYLLDDGDAKKYTGSVQIGY